MENARNTPPPPAAPLATAPPDTLTLLRAARAPALHRTRATDLPDLVAGLEVACETARVAALRRLRLATDRRDRTDSFADLFAALRRARSEVKRRETA